jgi:acid stress-induced BolA-like protein IbaG/YrbA
MTEKQVSDILTKHLKLKSPRFELEQVPGGKVSGSVISDSFIGQSDSERQKAIWDALEQELGEQCTSVVGTLLAYTDPEWNVDLAER